MNQNNGSESNDSGEFDTEGLEQALDVAADHMESGESTEEAATDQLMESIDSGEFEVTEPTPEEAAALSEETGEAQEGAAPATTGPTTDNSKAKPAPAYEAFIAAVQAHGEALGLQVKEQKGFFQFANAPTGHRLYVAKQGRSVTRVDTTLPRAALTVNGRDISISLSKPNGRIACHVDPTIESVTSALDVLATWTAKIEPPKKAVKAA